MAPALPFIVGAGVVLGAVGQQQDLEAQEEAAEFNAARAAENARMIRIESRKRAKKAVKAGAELKSTQRALFAKSGVLLTGSAQEVFAETERTTQEDVEAILMAGEAGSREALFEATQFTAEARAAKRAKTIAPLATLATGAASVQSVT